MGIIPLRVGDTMSIRISFTDKVTNLPIDMTGWNISLDMNTGDCDSTVTPPPVFSWIDQLQGIGRAVLDEDQTEDLAVPASYNLALRAESPSGNTTSTASVKVQVRG